MKHNNNIDREEQHDGILWPQVKYEDISEEDRCRLEYTSLPDVSKDEFEAWLAIQMTEQKLITEHYFSEWWCNLVGEERDLAVNYDLEAHMRYLRAKYKLVRMISDYDYDNDGVWLYALERQKMICIDAYLSRSKVADLKGNYTRKRWLCLCIKLLAYIIGEDEVTPEQLSQLNIKNSLDLISESERRYLLKANECEESTSSYRTYLLERLYRRKVERLYYRIRLEYTQSWWE